MSPNDEKERTLLQHIHNENEVMVVVVYTCVLRRSVCVAICVTVAGNGGLVVGECFCGRFCDSGWKRESAVGLVL